MLTSSRSLQALLGPCVAAALLLTACSPAGGSTPGTSDSAPTAASSSGSPGAAPSAPGGSPTGATTGASSTTGPSSPPAPTSTGTPGSSRSAEADDRAQLPGGGRTLFPTYRLVGYAGRTGSTALGRLGIGDLDTRVTELERRAKPYGADGRKVMPVLEVIATTVQADAGRDGKYRSRMPDSEVERYLAVARKHDALLLLAIQPGRADFLDEVEAYDRWLAEPDVGVALDPEWAMGPGQVPGRVFGHATGGELDQVARHLSAITTKDDLPEKVMVFHELAAGIVTKESALHEHRGVVVIKSVDGIGSAAAKESTYRVVNEATPKGVEPGFKLFYEEDRQVGRQLMTPTQVLALRPRPAYVMYE